MVPVRRNPGTGTAFAWVGVGLAIRQYRVARTRVTGVLAWVRRKMLAVHLRAAIGSGGMRHRGQSTVEYALVLLGAAAVALALVAWVTRSDAVGRLFDTVLSRILAGA